MSQFVCPHCKNPPTVEKRKSDGIVLITCHTCAICSDVATDIRSAQVAFTAYSMLVTPLNELRKWATKNFGSNP